ncbi:MAG: helix-turn-helix domain-containing protein [Anaerolineae bacterium]|nr:helix-turn-helix domain-containing protein [Anaerolineae bacterium]
MNIIEGERPSDSPFVERVWRNHSEQASAFTSVATPHWELVVTTLNGKTSVAVRGPETKATPAYCPPDGEFMGIVFKLGAFMPHLPVSTVMDRQNLDLPEATSRSFWLHGSAWEFPAYDNAEVFVNRLVRQDLLVWDSVVDDALQDRPQDLTIRTVRRRILRATGLTRGGILQIERARHAANLLQQGKSILDTVYEANYFDQPHLTRSLRHFIGYTPAHLGGAGASELMSF